jgi:hypothetical protein
MTGRGHSAELGLITGDGWLSQLISDATLQGACLQWGCTTCGSQPFRKAMWASATAANRTRPDLAIAEQLQQLPQFLDPTALRLILCDLDWRLGDAALLELSSSFERSAAGDEYHRMRAHHAMVLRERQAVLERQSPTAIAARRADKRSLRAEAHAERLERKKEKDAAWRAASLPKESAKSGTEEP